SVPEWSRNGPRLGASAILAAYVVVALLTHFAGQRPADLGLRLARCGRDVCVAWVMPAGYGWYRGVRPGMRVVSLNGSSVAGGPALHRLTEVDVKTPDGGILSARVWPGAPALSSAKLALWLTGASFALLGAAVLVRRPGAPAARLFAALAGLA